MFSSLVWKLKSEYFKIRLYTFLERAATLEGFQNGRVIPESSRSILYAEFSTRYENQNSVSEDISDTFLLLQVLNNLKLIRRT